MVGREEIDDGQEPDRVMSAPTSISSLRSCKRDKSSRPGASTARRCTGTRAVDSARQKGSRRLGAAGDEDNKNSDAPCRPATAEPLR